MTHIGDDPHWDPFIKQQYHSADLSFTFLNSDLSVIILYADMENLNYVIRLFFFKCQITHEYALIPVVFFKKDNPVCFIHA